MADDKPNTEETKDPSNLDHFMDSQRKALDETRKALEALIPGAFREHSQAAIKESLEGYRKLFNSMLDDVNSNLERFKMKDGDSEENQ